MCMKVRVTEGILQDSCRKLEASAEQIDQTTLSQSNTPLNQLNTELKQILIFICQQKRVNPTVCLFYTLYCRIYWSSSTSSQWIWIRFWSNFVELGWIDDE